MDDIDKINRKRYSEIKWGAMRWDEVGWADKITPITAR